MQLKITSIHDQKNHCFITPELSFNYVGKFTDGSNSNPKKKKINKIKLN